MGVFVQSHIPFKARCKYKEEYVLLQNNLVSCQETENKFNLVNVKKKYHNISDSWKRFSLLLKALIAFCDEFKRTFVFILFQSKVLNYLFNQSCLKKTEVSQFLSLLLDMSVPRLFNPQVKNNIK